MVIVYIETNLLIGLTLGQDPEAADLLAEAARRGDLRLAIPSICLMEATATIRGRVYEWQELRRRLQTEMTQVERNQTSPVAGELLDRLDKAESAIGGYAERVMADFREVIRRIQATSALIPFTKASLKEGFASILVEAKQPDLILPDNLILHCILDHARKHPSDSKAFLSGNSLEFSRPGVQEALKVAGIDKYFTDAKNALGWSRSRPAS